MKKVIFLFCLSLFILAPFQRASAQAEELEQLVLDIAKLAQFKAILKEMYQSYQILQKGYDFIKDLSQGSFNLHKLFLDGLLSVSPTVKKYQKVAAIISDQEILLKEYKSALSRFSGTNVFSSNELSYFQSVYSNLIDASLRNIDALAMVITDGTLRMNDAERLAAIDHIYADMEDKVEFLRSFDNNTSLLSAQRQSDLQETSNLKSIYGLPK